MNKLEVGYAFEHAFSFSQADVIKFAEVTGDNNPVHLDNDYAAKTPFKRPIIHGFLSGSVFSKVFGTIFPGQGTIYLSQELKFKKPMYVDEKYIAKFMIESINIEKALIEVSTSVCDFNGQVCIDGLARLMNKLLFV